MRSIIMVWIVVAATSVSQAQGLAPDSLLKVMGEILDKTTHEPLAYATIGVVGRLEQSYSQSNGGFIITLPSASINDTLTVSYVGYTLFKRRISELLPTAHILLETSVMFLPEVTVENKVIDFRYLDRNARLVRDTLYAMNCEVTNIEYNYFLNDLQERQLHQLFEVCDFDLSEYPKASADFYKMYHHSKVTKRRSRIDSLGGFGDYPAVNISHAAAIEYCNWLTDKYNDNTKKKKFKKVKFRLPTRKEWQIAALGYYKFQSWNLLENKVESIAIADTVGFSDKGQRIIIPVTDRVLYPWYKFYTLRDKPLNYKNCFLGNFHIDDAPDARKCPAQTPGFDGFVIQGRVGMYFPNNMGLFDVVGNVAEMIDEPGVAMGGSWKDSPKESTLRSIKKYAGPDESVGLRVFMVVVEK